MPERYKVSIIGAGKVGRTIAFQLLIENLVHDIVLFDENKNTLKAYVLDLQQVIPFNGLGEKIFLGEDYSMLTGSDIVVVAAGKPKQDNVKREDLLTPNAPLVQHVGAEIRSYAKDSIVIVVTNPYDVMTWLLLETTGFPRKRVMGSGGLLYEARFKSFLAQEFDVSPNDVKTLIMGGGSPHFLPILSQITIQGIPITDLLSQTEINKLVELTHKAAEEIINLLKNSAAYLAPAAAVTTLIKEIITPLNATTTAAVYADGEYGVQGVLNLPIRLYEKGIKEIVLDIPLSNKEQGFLRNAALHVQELYARLKGDKKTIK